MDHPYRTIAPHAPRRAWIDSTRASGLPLAALALAFVLYPLRVAMQSVGTFNSLAPTYIGAALLAVAIVMFRVAPRVSNVTGLIAVTQLLESEVMSLGLGRSFIFFIVSLAPALSLAFVAWRDRFGVGRLALWLDAYVFAALPIAMLNMRCNRYGAVLFVYAYAALVLIRAVRFGAARLNRFAAALRVARRARAQERRPAQ